MNPSRDRRCRGHGGRVGRGPRRLIQKNIKPGAHQRHMALYDAHLDEQLAKEAAEEARHQGGTASEPTAGDVALMPCLRTGGVVAVGTWISAGGDPPPADAPGATMTRRVGGVMPVVRFDQPSFEEVRESERRVVAAAMGGDSASQSRGFIAVFRCIRGELDKSRLHTLVERAIDDAGVRSSAAKAAMAKVLAASFKGAPPSGSSSAARADRR